MPTFTRVDSNGQTSLVQIDDPAAVQQIQADWEACNNNNKTITVQSQRGAITLQAITEPVAITVQEKAVGEPLAINLPAPNFNCYSEPPEPRGETRWLKYNEQTLTKNIEQNFNTTKTSVKENNIHHQHNRTVIQNVNRNHYHTQRIIVKDNNFHHYLTNNIIRINDIHHQKIEQVRGEGKTINDYKQTQRVEPAKCQANESVQVAASPAPTQQVCQPNQAITQLIAVPQSQSQSQSPEPQVITLTQQQPTSTINKIAYIPSGSAITNNGSARTIRQFQ